MALRPSKSWRKWAKGYVSEDCLYTDQSPGVRSRNILKEKNASPLVPLMLGEISCRYGGITSSQLTSLSPVEDCHARNSACAMTAGSNDQRRMAALQHARKAKERRLFKMPKLPPPWGKVEH